MPFDCGNNDLNDFFSVDAVKYTDQLLGKTYCFMLEENPEVMVCAFTLSNDSIKVSQLPSARKSKLVHAIPHRKQMKSYPAVLIGRLGVNQSFRFFAGETQTTGDQLMDFIKAWFTDEKNRTGCRYIIVDAYNEPKPLAFYTRNAFVFLFGDKAAEHEKKHYNLQKEEHLRTRFMYFDLITLKTKQEHKLVAGG